LNSSQPIAAPAADESLLCPQCGYDLRGITSDRCSECGLEIDRSDMNISAIPWAHRRQIGRLRAFVRTVWLITIDSKRIRHELARPQDAKDARRFRAVNAMCIAIALLGTAAVWLGTNGLESIAIQSSLGLVGVTTMGPRSGHIQDVAVPWCAGATILPVIPICIVGFSACLAGMGKCLIRLKQFHPDYRERARVLMTYAAAPIAWLVPIASLYGIAYGLRRLYSQISNPAMLRSFWMALEWLAIVLVALTALAAPHRMVQWQKRAAHGGIGGYTAGLAELVFRLIITAIIFLGIIPWCIGLAWIILDSFRQ
jgi:hypothetical protein